MDQSFWTARWTDGRIGFHQDQVHPQLQRFAPSPQLAKEGRRPSIVVPLCGKSLDLIWLSEQGFDVVGVEFVRRAIDDFFQQWRRRPECLQYAGHPAYRAGGITLVHADFFAFQAPERFDAVYDRAALVAIKPQDRARYAQHLTQLCRPGAELLLLSFIHDLASGPPHSVSDAELRELFGKSFGLRKIDEQDLLATSSSLTARGATLLVESVWAGVAAETQR